MKEHQEKLDNWYKNEGWRYWSELSILARLFEECGEFAEAVNHYFGEKQVREGKETPDLEMEIGDIIYTLICFANSHNISLDECIRKSFDKVMIRDKTRWGNEE